MNNNLNFFLITAFTLEDRNKVYGLKIRLVPETLLCINSTKHLPGPAQTAEPGNVGIIHIGVLAGLCHLPHNAPGCYHFYFKEH